MLHLMPLQFFVSVCGDKCTTNCHISLYQRYTVTFLMVLRVRGRICSISSHCILTRCFDNALTPSWYSVTCHCVSCSSFSVSNHHTWSRGSCWSFSLLFDCEQQRCVEAWDSYCELSL
jgi:hypothetical protein